ncbi:MAG TPA: tetratricopeptide repeat protein [Blastocatellia bacterium]|nr:tetratricopeptide repeat protein [Blastocatellia bacterium]
MHRLKAVTVILASLFFLLFVREQALAQARPNDIERAFAQAIQLHQAGDIEGAIRAYLEILKTHPNLVDARSNLGAAYARLGQYEDAITQYRRALTLEPRNQTVRLNLGLAYYKANLFTEASNEFSTLTRAFPEGSPERMQPLLLLADCWVRLGEFKKVIEMMTPLEAKYGNDRTFAYLLGSALISDNQVAKGQTLIDRVFRGEDSAEARLLIGSILLLADDGHGALKEFERALELNPKLPSLNAWYGRALMRMGDGEKAMTVFRTELASDPNNFDANVFLGSLLRREKQYDEAFKLLSRATRLRPRDAYARYHLGALYAAIGKPKEARPLLESVAKDHPDYVEARALLASVYYRLNMKVEGDRERAIVQKLNAEEQAKQPGVQNKNNQSSPGKVTTDSEQTIKP